MTARHCKYRKYRHDGNSPVGSVIARVIQEARLDGSGLISDDCRDGNRDVLAHWLGGEASRDTHRPMLRCRDMTAKTEPWTW